VLVLVNCATPIAVIYIVIREEVEGPDHFSRDKHLVGRNHHHHHGDDDDCDHDHHHHDRRNRKTRNRLIVDDNGLSDDYKALLRHGTNEDSYPTLPGSGLSTANNSARFLDDDDLFAPEVSTVPSVLYVVLCNLLSYSTCSYPFC
jgi:hypothetical protein